jgi:hypothetical protein
MNPWAVGQHRLDRPFFRRINAANFNRGQAVFGDFSQLVMQRLKSVGRVNRLPDFWGIFEKFAEVSPAFVPGTVKGLTKSPRG